MSRPADSPQGIWQAKYYEIVPLSVSASMWWFNPINYNSLRLTHTAYLKLKPLIKFHKFQLLDEIRPKTLVQLERHLTEPYYMQNRKTIHLTSDSEAMMLGLHANNLQQYLDNFSR